MQNRKIGTNPTKVLYRPQKRVNFDILFIMIGRKDSWGRTINELLDHVGYCVISLLGRIQTVIPKYALWQRNVIARRTTSLGTEWVASVIWVAWAVWATRWLFVLPIDHRGSGKKRTQLTPILSDPTRPSVTHYHVNHIYCVETRKPKEGIKPR